MVLQVWSGSCALLVGLHNDINHFTSTESKVNLKRDCIMKHVIEEASENKRTCDKE